MMMMMMTVMEQLLCCADLPRTLPFAPTKADHPHAAAPVDSNSFDGSPVPSKERNPSSICGQHWSPPPTSPRPFLDSTFHRSTIPCPSCNAILPDSVPERVKLVLVTQKEGFVVVPRSIT